MGITKAVDATRISLPPSVDVVIPIRRRQEPAAFIAPNSDATFTTQLTELIGIVRKIEEKLPVLPQTKTLKISLVGRVVSFDEAKPAVMVDERTCALPPAKNEEYLAKVMFSRPVGEFVDWSIVYREMTGNDEVIAEKAGQKAVRDTMDRLNKRMQDVIGTDDQLLGWENKSICRRY